MNDKLYFDPEDDEADGHGWNVVDEANDGAIAARYRDKVTALVAMLDNEDEGLRLLHTLKREFGWAGTVFTRDDVETVWREHPTVWDAHGDAASEVVLPDGVWDAVRGGWYWRKGMDEILVERGFDLLNTAVDEAVNEPKAGEFG